jgi:hypothetical protein
VERGSGDHRGDAAWMRAHRGVAHTGDRGFIKRKGSAWCQAQRAPGWQPAGPAAGDSISGSPSARS